MFLVHVNIDLNIPLRLIPKEDSLHRWRFCKLGSEQKLADQYMEDNSAEFTGQESVSIPATCEEYLRDGSASKISPSHSTLTPSQPDLELTIQCQAPDRVATRVPIYKVTGMIQPGKS